MKKLFGIIILLALPAFSQRINGTVCTNQWDFVDRPNCFRSITLGIPAAYMYCACVSRCANGVLTDVHFYVYWNVTPPGTGTGTINGRSIGYATRIDGRVQLNCAGAIFGVSDSGWDQQDCDGYRDFKRFDLPCPSAWSGAYGYGSGSR